MTFIARTKLFLGIIPVLIGCLKAVEDAIPGTGKGEQKLAMIREALEAAYDAADDATEGFDSIWPVMAKWIAKQVARFNEIGIFRK
jgi:hypothetical protein